METIFESAKYGALRISENDISIYLDNISRVLAKYSWIYNFRNIDIFVYDVLDHIPVNWVKELSDISAEELWQLPFGYQKEEWSGSLKTFLTDCQTLGSCRFAAKKFETSLTQNNLLKKLSDKKQHEVQIMSHLMKQVCQALDCNVVVDIGSGLGYLDQALHNNFGLYSIGLDAVQKYTLAARIRLKSEPCKQSILHETLKVESSEKTLLEIQAVLDKAKELKCNCISKGAINSEKKSTQFIMAGLHSCGDLSQDMMKLFCELEEIKGFVCIGCCYNKIDLSNFPMSSAAKHSVKSTQEFDPLWCPSIFGLRLAAHGTRSHPDSFPISREREINLFYRSILEYYIKKENITWKQPKRHVRPTDLENFSTYISKMFEGHPLNEDVKVFDDLLTLFNEKLGVFYKFRILLVLQMMLQPLWEVFVVLDRVMYFKERNISVEVLEMWSDSVSCRNLALCAYKR